MKRLTSLILLAVAGTAQPLQAQNIINPLTLLSPSQGNPWSGSYGNLSNPFGLGALNPLNPLNSINPLSPWNNYGGMSNPVLSLGALGALNALTPSLPGGSPFNNVPYGGNTYSNNPFARSAQPQPFGAPAFSPSLPSLPNVPFAAQQQNIMPGGFYPMQPQMGWPQQAYYPPYGMQQAQQPTLGNFFGMQQPPAQPPISPGSFFGMQPQPVQPQARPGNFFGMQQQPVQPQQTLGNFFGTQPQAPQQRPPAQTQQPGMPNLFGMTQPAAQPAQPMPPQPAQQSSSYLPFPWQQPPLAQPAPPQTSSPQIATTPQTPQAFTLPFFFSPPPVPATPAAEAMPKPAAAATPEVKAGDTGALAPLDPAAFMQMYMKPQ